MEKTQEEKEKKFKQKIGTCKEHTLFIMIESLGGMIWRINHDWADGRGDYGNTPQSIKDTNKFLLDLQKNITLCVKETTRIGIKNPLKEDGRATEEYRCWYKKWDRWYNGMDYETKNKFMDLFDKDENHQELSEYFPLDYNIGK